MDSTVRSLNENEYQQFHEMGFLHDVLEGLTQTKKSLPPKYFYDELGSKYFDEICRLPEYYPYRCELKLLDKVAKDLEVELNGQYSLIEFGAGSLQKVGKLLNHLRGIREFFPVDISSEHLIQSVGDLAKAYPQVKMAPIVADFCEPVSLGECHFSKLGFFPGSTIGNFTPEQACQFLISCKETLGDGAKFLVGVDTKKSPRMLHAAYNDALATTKKFNLNILNRINKELQGTIELDNFEHYAFYNASQGCIEMHLVSTEDQCAKVKGIDVEFSQGESIHTESSYKYTPKEFSSLARQAGWSVDRVWMAEKDLFSMYLLSTYPCPN